MSWGEVSFSCFASRPQASSSPVGLPCCPPTLTGQKNSDTQWKSQTEQGHPNTGAETSPGTPDVPAEEMRHSLIWHTFWTNRGVSLLGCLGTRGATAGLGARALGWVQQLPSAEPAACQIPTFNSFPILYSLPADNRLSIRSPPEHLQLSSLSRTSARPRASGSIPNCSHTPDMCNSSVPKTALTREAG